MEKGSTAPLLDALCRFRDRVRDHVLLSIRENKDDEEFAACIERACDEARAEVLAICGVDLDEWRGRTTATCAAERRDSRQ